MAIDNARVTSLIDELGLEGADKDYFTKVLTTNEKAATQFVGQRERHDLLTRRTQDLSTKERDLERRANEQVTAYAQQLQEADDRIKKIMTDFEKAEISRATAEARLMKVKETYNLSDEDIPVVQVQQQQRQQEPQSLDIKKILTDFKRELLSELSPELAAFPRVAAIQNEILARHQELIGKRLTQVEMEELMKTSQAENGPSLMNAWRQKFGIDAIEKTKEREEWSKEDRRKWDDEQKARASEEALRGVKRSADGNIKHLSPVFREYQTHDEPGTRDMTPAARQQQQQDHQQQRTTEVQNTPKLSGAERAAARFMERRNAGIPMGAPEPVSK